MNLQGEKIYAYPPSGNRVLAGVIVNQRVFFKDARSSLHKLNHPDGWGIDQDVLNRLIAKGVERIRILYSGKVYEIAIADLIAKTLVEIDYHDYGKQWVIFRSYCTVFDIMGGEEEAAHAE